jgi:hypothetical protein
MTSILSAVHFVAVFSSINVQLFECRRSVFTSITSKMIFRCTKIISCEEILVFPIKIMYLFSRSTKFPIYYLLYNLFFQLHKRSAGDRVRQIQRGLRKSQLKRRTSILRQRWQGLGRGVYGCMSKLVNGFKNNYPLKQII